MQPRLAGLRTRLACTSTNGSCDIARYTWDETFPSKITDVNRPGVSTGGALTTLADEDFTWELVNAKELVRLHRSLGVEVEALSVAPLPSLPALYTMTWRRNSPSATEDFTFDDNGNLVQCSSGMCGDADVARVYQDHWPFDHYSLGPAVVLGEDGFSTFRQYNNAGLLEFQCEAAFSATGDQDCALDPSLGRVWVTSPSTTHVRHLERRYYDDNGRLWARAVYDPETRLSDAMSFPTSTSDPVVNWFSSAPLSPSSCPSLTTEASIGGVTHRWRGATMRRKSTRRAPRSATRVVLLCTPPTSPRTTPAPSAGSPRTATPPPAAPPTTSSSPPTSAAQRTRGSGSATSSWPYARHRARATQTARPRRAAAG
ncbi:MAG: hypothetical protein A2138_01760 [Deltaproteobacteria bacterium RBG_16_71_12]|nr:MAG: hypothetical protein A2138_01760 [Deltaproteobacteria bacterium RBG_16_71_12]